MALTLGVSLGLCACRGTRRVTEPMTWSDEQQPGPLRPLPSDGLRLTFVDAPNQHVAVTGVPELLASLRRRKSHRVTVEFDVHCSPWHARVETFNVRKIEDFPVPGNADGWVESTGEQPGAAGPFLGACR